MKMIAVDIDDVLAMHADAFIEYSNKKWGTRLSISDYDEHWGDVWGVDHMEVEKRAQELHGSGIMGRLKRHKDGDVVLNKLSKRYKLVVATSRRSQIAKETNDWLMKYYDGLFQEVHFAGMWDKVNEQSNLVTKKELCLNIGADYLIDDQVKHCKSVDSVGIKAILFGNYSWNKADDLPKSIHRARNWKEVEEYFDKE